MRTLITLLLALVLSATAFQPAKLYSVRTALNCAAEPVFERWRTPAYPAEQLEAMWKDRDSLMTIGGAGVTATHINSLKNLLSEHPAVRIKLASNRIDAYAVSKLFMADEALDLKADLLEVRRTSLMFGRKQ
mmetsp:Transcript_7956/g.17814  ORF Transcript_7956/g.17814 Transcript_7956/m.17814 type:complete len:132 (+) Transcript_7956:141-536(+)